MLQIDSRENSDLSDAVERLCGTMFVDCEKKWLEVGDYVIGDVCIEAKSIEDFIMSAMNKRIWNQVDNMDRCFKNTFVVIYGEVAEGMMKARKYNQHFTIKGMHNKFFSSFGRIALDTDTKPILVSTHKEAAKIIVTIAKMQPHDRPVIRPTVMKRVVSHDIRINALTSIKGVSEKKAKELLKNFGSIMEIGEVKPAEIAKLKGLGMVTAKRINSVLNEEKEVKQ
tara:strand:+ start:19471 stop:20145 length:675 start_codon:yes stop_codon:yes gene_type:complete